jgi:hypothetical protein
MTASSFLAPLGISHPTRPAGLSRLRGVSAGTLAPRESRLCLATNRWIRVCPAQGGYTESRAERGERVVRPALPPRAAPSGEWRLDGRDAARPYRRSAHS